MKQEVFENVWLALERNEEDAINLTMRSHLMIAIEKQVAKWKLSQEDAAKRLGVTRPRLSDLLRGKINKFSLDSLMMIAVRAGLKVELSIGAGKKRKAA
jgi:predicted XRE-type DNA-binding protein